MFSRHELLDRLRSITTSMQSTLRIAESDRSRDAAETARLVEASAESGECYAARLEAMYAGAVAPDDRRRELRWPHLLDIEIMPFLVEGGFTRAKLVDFSTHGLGILTDVPVTQGAQLVVKVKLKTIFLLTADVRNCRAQDEVYRLGTEITGFVGPPEAAQADFEEGLTAFIESMHTAATGRH